MSAEPVVRAPEPPRDTASFGHRAWYGAVIGLVSAGVALGIGEVVAAIVRPIAAPAIAVGNRAIVLTPEPIKLWAIRHFATSDKTVLLTGIYAMLAVFALVVGVLAVWRIAAGLAGIAVFAAVGCYCALTAPAGRASDVWPTLIGAAAAAATLVFLVGTLDAPDAAAGATSRRRFLAGGAAAAGVALLADFGGRAAERARFNVSAARSKVRLPRPTNTDPAPARFDLGKSPVPWQTPNGGFYRVDTALEVPQIEPKDWSLRIHGMVDHPMTLSYDQLRARPMIERWITLCCVSNLVGGNLVGNANFLGTRLADLLREVGIQSGADQLLLTSQDRMTIGSPTAVVMDGRDSLLAIGMNGAPLPIDHGFPVRVVVPGLYGYVSACKWVVDIEATTFADARAYWVQGGWLPHPDIAVASRIDTPHSGSGVTAGKSVAVAGVAWDQHVGVSAVQVQVDNGQWQTARLAPVPSTDTWRQWVLPWTPAKPGSYTLRVRAVDAQGQVQASARHEPYPGPSSGYHTITVRAS